MDINPIGMLKSENINGINIYLSGIRRGADALVLNTENGNLFLVEVMFIMNMWDYDREYIFRDDHGSYDYGPHRNFDFFLPFFAEDDDYYVGINIRHECKDTHNVQSTKEYMRWAGGTNGNEWMFRLKDDGSFVERDAERNRHKMHREIKHRMYAERIARRKAKGVVCNG